jgi:hypothetical protein
MFNTGKLGALLAGAALAASLNSQVANAASGTISVDIDFPPLVILYYFDDLDITVDADDLEDVILDELTACAGGSGTASEVECAADESPKALTTGTVSGSTITYDADIGSDTLVSADLTNTTVSFTVENAWAVRALASGLTASATLGAGDFSNVSVTPTSPTPSLTLTDGANIGDISFDVDLSAIAGLTASDTITVTVVSP